MADQIYRRSIELIGPEDSLEFTADKTAQAAMAYFCFWAVSSEQKRHVSLIVLKNGDLMADYFDSPEKKEPTYQILGMRGEAGDYSFHS